MSNKPINYTDNDRAIVAVLKNASEPMTLAAISEVAGRTILPGHIVAAMRKQLVDKVGEVEVMKPGTRQVATYSFVTADPTNKADGSVNSYTDKERAILTAAASIDSPFTLADLATAMGVDKISSGSTNNLIKKGNLAKGDKVNVDTMVKSMVSVYAFKTDIAE